MPWSFSTETTGFKPEISGIGRDVDLPPFQIPEISVNIFGDLFEARNI